VDTKVGVGSGGVGGEGSGQGMGVVCGYGWNGGWRGEGRRWAWTVEGAVSSEHGRGVYGGRGRKRGHGQR
jgi:hypothetical protein